jgi:hypothetical protein
VTTSGMGWFVFKALLNSIQKRRWNVWSQGGDPPHAKRGWACPRQVRALVDMLSVCLMSWLFALSCDEAHAALERALETQSESERKLSSLLESTEDVVCSLSCTSRGLGQGATFTIEVSLTA